MLSAKHNAQRNTDTFADYSAEDIVTCFTNSLTSSNHVRQPYDYWLLKCALPDSLINTLLTLPYAVPANMDFAAGKRDGGANNKVRVYFNPQNQRKFPICKTMVEAFKDDNLIASIERLTGQNLRAGHLRIEYCQDTDGFWLEPHVDISVKLFTMSIYLSDDPALSDAGTDIYDDTPEHNRVATAPFNQGSGMIFIPAHNTWHGFSKRPIHGVRKSLIVNYVTQDWRAVEELA